MFAEGAAADWSAVYLEDSLGATAAVAATGFAAYSLAMAGGRLVGDRLTLRWGPSAAGAVRAPGVGGHRRRAGRRPPGRGDRRLRPPRGRGGARRPRRLPGGRQHPGVPGSQGIATVAWLGYLGFLAGPPVIGLTADAIGLPGALGIVCGTTAAVALLAGATRTVPAIRTEGAPRA